jgi:large subunit ribosomal protein L25
MKAVSISGSPRESVGKKDAKKQRNEGLIPCVLYGGKEQVTFTVQEPEMKKLVYTPDVFTVKLDIKGTNYDAIIQELQFHPVSDKVIHVDFLQLFPDKQIIMDIPVKLKGNPVGVLKGGKIYQKLRKIKSKALPEKLPDYIEIDISAMEIGDSVKVSDVTREGIAFLNPPSAMVVMVRMTRVIIEEVKPGEEKTETPAAGTTPAVPGASGTPAPAVAPGKTPAGKGPAGKTPPAK